MLGYLFKAYPWHRIPIGDEFPELVNAYIEVVPGDTIKYELDESTGHLKVDRPQAYCNVCPTMYGLIPQTWCNDYSKRFSRLESLLEDALAGE